MGGGAAGDVIALERQRARLFGLAYRMLGSVADAEDAVQETLLRWQATERAAIASPDAWLTTVCTRVCIDALRAAYRRRELYVGPWLPEPLVGAAAGAAEPEPSLSLAFLLLLERLSPLERAAFLLREVFDYDYAQLAAVLGRSETACRQLVSRAGRHVAAGGARFDAAPRDAEALFAAFLEAARAGAVERLEALLARDAELWSDSDGKATAARNVLRGANRIARFLVGVAADASDVEVGFRTINGGPGVLLKRAGVVMAAITVAVDEHERIARVFIVVNPEKLHDEL